ncbi:hypothetical protein DM01DRAFT_1403720 [Hesseltinella vesiculosa]|uniref:Histone chaperone domain-containing protein n=1 Tax=Hesseltinella vesiculosa TaxID=101127 RepID=A0A1X2GVD6_9FUNG|nr:hypothetical protein DM01DRAFT_1403720 [Hesseltinella vesiculosa]
MTENGVTHKRQLSSDATEDKLLKKQKSIVNDDASDPEPEFDDNEEEDEEDLGEEDLEDEEDDQEEEDDDEEDEEEDEDLPEEDDEDDHAPAHLSGRSRNAGSSSSKPTDYSDEDAEGISDDELAEIDTTAILSSGRRTRGKKIDFSKVSDEGDDDEDDE